MPTPSITPSLLEPGLWRSDPSLERYQVKGGGIVVVRLRPGDTITIQDPQGRQVGEVIVFDKNGCPAPGALSNHSVQKPTGLGSILSDRDLEVRCHKGPQPEIQHPRQWVHHWGGRIFRIRAHLCSPFARPSQVGHRNDAIGQW